MKLIRGLDSDLFRLYIDDNFTWSLQNLQPVQRIIPEYAIVPGYIGRSYGCQVANGIVGIRLFLIFLSAPGLATVKRPDWSNTLSTVPPEPLSMPLAMPKGR